MSAFPEVRIAAVAGALHHSTATNTTINAGDVIIPLQVISSGLSASFSYTSSGPNAGLFTLDSNKKYYVESNIYVEAQNVTYNCLHGFTDSGGTELTDSARGRQTGPTPSTYYNTFSLVSDETAYAIIDGSVTASFYWKILEINRPPNNNNALELDSTYPTYDTYLATKTRLMIREYS